MRQKSGTREKRGDKVVKDIRRAARKQCSAEEEIRIVLDGLKGEDSIDELCRRAGIAQSPFSIGTMDTGAGARSSRIETRFRSCGRGRQF